MSVAVIDHNIIATSTDRDRGEQSVSANVAGTAASEPAERVVLDPNGGSEDDHDVLALKMDYRDDLVQLKLAPGAEMGGVRDNIIKIETPRGLSTPHQGLAKMASRSAGSTPLLTPTSHHAMASHTVTHSHTHTRALTAAMPQRIELSQQIARSTIGHARHQTSAAATTTTTTTWSATTTSATSSIATSPVPAKTSATATPITTRSLASSISRARTAFTTSLAAHGPSAPTRARTSTIGERRDSTTSTTSASCSSSVVEGENRVQFAVSVPCAKPSKEPLREADVMLLTAGEANGNSGEGGGGRRNSVSKSMSKSRSGNTIELRRLLNDEYEAPLSAKAFQEYVLEHEYGDESVQFYNRVQKFKMTTSFWDRAQLVKEIYETHLKDGSAQEINISGELKHSILADIRPILDNDAEAYESQTMDNKVFDEAQMEIERLLYRNSLPRFIRKSIVSSYPSSASAMAGVGIACAVVLLIMVAFLHLTGVSRWYRLFMKCLPRFIRKSIVSSYPSSASAMAGVGIACLVVLLIMAVFLHLTGVSRWYRLFMLIPLWGTIYCPTVINMNV